ncbi:MAG: hypothetical protein LBQ97_04860 [Fusobacteriaceae bacterium]|nr:hypothetical protein [Fusobacteriaceae bacterium]
MEDSRKILIKKILWLLMKLALTALSCSMGFYAFLVIMLGTTIPGPLLIYELLLFLLALGATFPLYAAFVFFVNEKNPVDSLTAGQIRDIYGGKIKNWKEVGGPDIPQGQHDHERELSPDRLALRRDLGREPQSQCG